MRVVALRALGLGDLLTAVPALRALRQAFPLAARAVAAPAPLAPLVRLVGWELIPVGPLEPLPPQAARADLLVNLHGRGPQSHRVALAARPRRLIAFANAEVPESAEGPAFRDDEHEVRRWCRLLVESGIPADPGALHLPTPRLPDELATARGATVIHPGAASEARRWPAGRFAEVARAEAAAGRAVVLTGGPHERPLAAEVARLAGLGSNVALAGRTSLVELAAVVGAAARVVCGDTGVAHLATALGRPSVLLFGPTSPDAWGPPPHDRHRVLWAGRTGDPHAHAPHDGLLDIEADDVLGALTTLP